MRFRLSLAAEYALTAAICAGTALLMALEIGERAPIPLQALRLLLGLAMTLLLPGYYLHLLLFPKREHLRLIERFGLSFVLSIAIIPSSALLLDTLGVPLTPTTNFLFLLAVISAAGIGAAWLRLRLPLAARFTLALDAGELFSLADAPPLIRGLALLAGAALILGTAFVLLIATQPAPSETFTEFYLLGADGFADAFPRRIALGDSAALTVGIYNAEGQSMRYSFEVLDGDAAIYRSEVIALEPDARYEAPVRLTPVSAGENVILTFHLYREGEAQVYRELRLALAVDAPTE